MARIRQWPRSCANSSVIEANCGGDHSVVPHRGPADFPSSGTTEQECLGIHASQRVRDRVIAKRFLRPEENHEMCRPEWVRCRSDNGPSRCRRPLFLSYEHRILLWMGIAIARRGAISLLCQAPKAGFSGRSRRLNGPENQASAGSHYKDDSASFSGWEYP